MAVFIANSNLRVLNKLTISKINLRTVDTGSGTYHHNDERSESRFQNGKCDLLPSPKIPAHAHKL